MFQTDFAVPTGDYLEEWLEDNGMTQAELARRTGVSRKHISTVIGGAAVTADFACKLELTTGVPAQRWLALEAAYRSDLVRLGAEEALAEERELAAAFKESAAHLRRAGLIDADMRHPGRLLMQLMAFFRVGDVSALRPSVLVPQASFLQSAAFTPEQASVATWLRLAALEAQGQEMPAAFDTDRLRDLLPQVRSLSTSADAVRTAAADHLAEAGITVLRVPEVSGCRAFGATTWEGGRPLVTLSARGKTDGALWFALFHELGHVLLHPGTPHIDDDAADSLEAQEQAANSFAEDQLVPEQLRDELYAARSKEEITRIAADSAVSPGVLLHHLHHHQKWEWRHGRDLYQRVEFEDRP